MRFLSLEKLWCVIVLGVRRPNVEFWFVNAISTAGKGFGGDDIIYLRLLGAFLHSSGAV